MFRFGLPSFKLLIAGAIAAAAFAYYKGELPELSKSGGGKARPEAAGQAPVPPKPVPPRKVATPVPAKPVPQRASAQGAIAPTPRPVKSLAMPRPKALATGSVAKQAKRPPASVPATK